VRSTRAFLFGAGAAYLFDPRQGRRRRHVLRDRSAAIARRTSRLGAKKTRFVGGHARGILARGRRLATGRELASDDAKIVQRIRSDALRTVGLSTKDVEVGVEDGVATLRGTVASRSLADDLVGQVSKVPGVRDVAAMIRIANGTGT